MSRELSVEELSALRDTARASLYISISTLSIIVTQVIDLLKPVTIDLSIDWNTFMLSIRIEGPLESLVAQLTISILSTSIFLELVFAILIPALKSLLRTTASERMVVNAALALYGVGGALAIASSMLCLAHIRAIAMNAPTTSALVLAVVSMYLSEVLGFAGDIVIAIAFALLSRKLLSSRLLALSMVFIFLSLTIVLYPLAWALIYWELKRLAYAKTYTEKKVM